MVRGTWDVCLASGEPCQAGRQFGNDSPRTIPDIAPNRTNLAFPLRCNPRKMGESTRCSVFVQGKPQHPFLREPARLHIQGVEATTAETFTPSRNSIAC